MTQTFDKVIEDIRHKKISFDDFIKFASSHPLTLSQDLQLMEEIAAAHQTVEADNAAHPSRVSPTQFGLFSHASKMGAQQNEKMFATFVAKMKEWQANQAKQVTDIFNIDPATNATRGAIKAGSKEAWDHGPRAGVASGGLSVLLTSHRNPADTPSLSEDGQSRKMP